MKMIKVDEQVLKTMFDKLDEEIAKNKAANPEAYKPQKDKLKIERRGIFQRFLDCFKRN